MASSSTFYKYLSKIGLDSYEETDVFANNKVEEYSEIADDNDNTQTINSSALNPLLNRVDVLLYRQTLLTRKIEKANCRKDFKQTTRARRELEKIRVEFESIRMDLRQLGESEEKEETADTKHVHIHTKKQVPLRSNTVPSPQVPYPSSAEVVNSTVVIHPETSRIDFSTCIQSTQMETEYDLSQMMTSETSVVVE